MYEECRTEQNRTEQTVHRHISKLVHTCDCVQQGSSPPGDQLQGCSCSGHNVFFQGHMRAQAAGGLSSSNEMAVREKACCFIFSFFITCIWGANLVFC